MTITRYIRKINWRAAGVLLMMFIWSATPAIASVMPDPIQCGMQCCIEDGHCCCSTRADELEGSRNEQASLGRAVIEQGCPMNCAALSSAPQTSLRSLDQQLTFAEPEEESLLSFATTITHHHNSPSSDPASPRAPPRS